MTIRRSTLQPLLILLLVRSMAEAQTAPLRLSEPTAWDGTINWFGSPWSADGEWLVFSHDATVEGAFELWSVRRAGGEPIRLTHPLPAGIFPAEAAISPDSARVVYLIDQETTTVKELWSVPIGGPSAAAVKLHPTPVAGGDALEPWAFTPDGSRVVFRGDLAVDGTTELWSAPVDGPAGALVRLNPDAVAGGSVTSFVLSPDGTYVVFRGDLEVDERFELWSVPVEGPASAAQKLHATPIGNGDVFDDFRISADSERVIFRGDLPVDELNELWSAPLDGAEAAVKLNPVATPGGDVFLFDLPPAGERLVFRADLSTDNTIELWSVPLAGPATDAVKLNPAPVAGGEANYRPGFTPDGSRVLFAADLLVNGVDELWSVPVAGPAEAAIRLNPTPVAGGRVANSAWRVSPDGAHVIFLGDLAVFNRFELWIAAVDGETGSAVAISGAVTAGGNVSGFAITPDSQRVLFDGDLSSDGRRQLYSARLDDPSSRLRLTTLQQADSNVGLYQIDAASESVYLLLDHPVDEQPQLHRADVDRAGFQRVNRLLEPGELVHSLFVAPGGGGVAHAIGSSSGAFELWVADEWILHADFDEGTTEEWSSATP